MFAAFLAAAALHASLPSPAAQLEMAQRTASFHVLVFPSSIQLLRAEASHDGTDVRLEYSTEGVVVDVDERPAAPADTPSPGMTGELFNLDGYPAFYREFAGFRELSTLTWYRSDLTVTLSSRDRVNAPLLIDIALELR